MHPWPLSRAIVASGGRRKAAAAPRVAVARLHPARPDEYRGERVWDACDQSPFAFSFIAASSLAMSAGDNCGRSSLSVSLFSFAVSAKGGR